MLIKVEGVKAHFLLRQTYHHRPILACSWTFLIQLFFRQTIIRQWSWKRRQQHGGKLTYHDHTYQAYIRILPLLATNIHYYCNTFPYLTTIINSDYCTLGRIMTKINPYYDGNPSADLRYWTVSAYCTSCSQRKNCPNFWMTKLTNRDILLPCEWAL